MHHVPQQTDRDPCAAGHAAASVPAGAAFPIDGSHVRVSAARRGARRPAGAAASARRATRLREPFAWLLFIPAAVILLILLYQFLSGPRGGLDLPVLRLLSTDDARIITVESAFAAYMLAFSVRTGKGI